MNHEAFTFRSPWYARERGNFSLTDPRAKPPVIQKYDSTRFVEQVTKDPWDSLKFIDEDRFSYPVPVAFPAPGTGRERFATSRLVRSKLRKLYQPNHDRFYLVVVELFCDAPGLPRAGSHRDDIEVGLVLRRNQTTFTGAPADLRKLSRALLKTLTDNQLPNIPLASNLCTGTPDVDDLWWANEAFDQLTRDQADLLKAVSPQIEEQAWLVDSTTNTSRWDKALAQTPTAQEQVYPMFRIPDTAAHCEKGKTRSLWFGLVPTYSAEHWEESNRLVPKLDERAIYHIRTVVTRKRPAGQEHCPPLQWWSERTEPFRLAAPYDPEGTKNRKVSITAPDFRALAARAGKPLGPGGFTINTPPGSQMTFNPFGGVPKPGSGSMGDGGICTFAFELFFIIALFLFLMFMPIVVFAFQLWWMLALRFCFPRLNLQMDVLADFFADAHVDIIADAAADADVVLALDVVFGVSRLPASTDPGILQSLKDSPTFAANAKTMPDLVDATDPEKVLAPSPPPAESKPSDPLCPVT